MRQANGKKTTTEIYSSIARAMFFGAALIATIWVIGALNAGTLFTGENSTARLLAIPAQRSR